MYIEISDAYADTIKEIAIKESTSYHNVIKNAIRVYQLVVTGHSKIVEVNPIRKSIFQDPPM